MPNPRRLSNYTDKLRENYSCIKKYGERPYPIRGFSLPITVQTWNTRQTDRSGMAGMRITRCVIHSPRSTIWQVTSDPHLAVCTYPPNMRRRPNVGLLLGHRRRRWATVNQRWANVSYLLCSRLRLCKSSNQRWCRSRSRSRCWFNSGPAS